MKKLFMLCILPAFFFHTSAQSEIVQPDYLITKITISCEQDFPTQRQFTDQESMRKILQYLRGTALYGEADGDSMSKNAPLYTISLSHSTGRVTMYRQIAGDYLAKDSSPWYQLDPEEGQLLYALYHNLPGPASL